MSAIERRIAIWHTLCIRREVKIKTLVKEHNVSWIIIYRDIEYLSLSHSIITTRGRYGGVKLPDWYIPSANHLSPEQLAFLDRLYLSLNSEDANDEKYHFNAFIQIGNKTCAKCISRTFKTEYLCCRYVLL